jgi:hypothetical protein
VSTLYGVLVVAAAALGLCESAPTEQTKTLFCIAAGYYLWALSFTLFERGPATLASVHHFCW